MALQMSWQPNLLSHKRKTAPPIGLRNLGNSCYLNSVLQCLTFTPPLANFSLRSQHSLPCDSPGSSCPFCILEKQIARLLRADLTSDAPSKILSCLRLFAEHFRCGRQEDAHEFLRYVIDACHNSCLRLKKLRKKGGGGGEGGASVVKEIFGGALQSQVKCLCCGYESNKVDEMMDISLDVFHSNSLRDSMQKFFQPEVLDGNNKYKCDGCKKLVTAKKQMSILQAPNVLVIQLKRFEGILGGKIDKTVGFEEVLVLSSFMCKASQDPQPEYKLFGTIVHSGYSQESGHYYAYVKDAMGRWYCCDDSCVTLATLQEVLSEKVYILFFSRTNQRPASVSSSIASNGVKPHHSNGSQTSESSKVDVQLKTAKAKSNSDQSSWKDMPSVSKIGKVPSGLRVKFDINGSSTSKKSPAHVSVNGKVDMTSSQPLLTNGHAKELVSLENGRKDPSSSLPTMNGFAKNKVDVANNSIRKESTVTNGYTGIQTVDTDYVKPDPPEDIDRSQVISGTGPGNIKRESNGVINKSKMLGNKRKVQEAPCNLLAHDDQSRARVEELKDNLGKEAKSVLRSSGWADKVDEYMSMRKRLHEKEAENLKSDVKRKLIQDARSVFTSQIPESLRKELIARLQSFSQEKVHVEGP
ncbi:ubiquitin carboxyl-terminal hydrolase 25 [Vicia villosa]|uniref:ubiquitin carboxyl-terminal hydrolase 25 n=1 Tax=Vicia villosa TaxID=3911 RepID=UPI00273BF397|nr:ubiquitin carboxyl-terminal hydrolase 25 [Vicia villosa]XP_058722742.1 ubiquitin carboxyl-terminal hydrolase 25 [Vicia villosa]